MNPDLERIASFLARIGIDVVEAEVPESSFLPGVAIASGRLVFDRAWLRP